VGAGQEVAEIDEFAVLLVLDIDSTPSVLAATDSLAVDVDVAFAADDGERNDGLDLRVHGGLFTVVLLVLVWVHANVVESELLLDAVLEELSLLQGETIGLGDDRNDIDSLAQFLQDNNVDGLEGVAGGGNEIQAAVDASVLDVPLTLSGELLAQVCAVLVLDVLHNGVPAAVVVDEVAVARGVYNVQSGARNFLQ